MIAVLFTGARANDLQPKEVNILTIEQEADYYRGQLRVNIDLIVNRYKKQLNEKFNPAADSLSAR